MHHKIFSFRQKGAQHTPLHIVYVNIEKKHLQVPNMDGTQVS